MLTQISESEYLFSPQILVKKPDSFKFLPSINMNFFIEDSLSGSYDSNISDGPGDGFQRVETVSIVLKV